MIRCFLCGESARHGIVMQEAKRKDQFRFRPEKRIPVCTACARRLEKNNPDAVVHWLAPESHGPAVKK